MTTQTIAGAEVRAVLEQWAAATRQGRAGDILKNHAANVMIFDVLPPMRSDSVESYRRSREIGQPQTRGEAVFDLENPTINGGNDIAFVHGFIRCGGTLPGGKSFEDVVRATFCLRKLNGAWVVQNQHVSKPWEHE